MTVESGAGASSGAEKPIDVRTEVLTRETIADIFATVQGALEAELAELQLTQPELMAPVDEQLEHAHKVAKNIGGQEVASKLADLIFKQD